MSSTTPITLPSPTSTSLGFGMIPIYPSSLLLSDSVLVNCILADIPFFITGILGFAVITFFIILRQTNRFVALITSAVLMQFIAGILDLSQLLDRGRAVQIGTDVAKVSGIIIVREVALSLAPGFQFLFFWFYVGLPPRGELERPYGGRTYSRALGIVNYRGAYHSGRWDRWGFVGSVLQWVLLGAVTTVPVLEAAWRTTAFTVAFGPIYNASSTLEIILSALLALKLLGNVWMAVNLSYLRTFRDYVPIISSLLIGLGVSVGNTVLFKFSDTVLGRFLQAVEAYIVLVYVMTATFYRVSFDDAVLPDSNPTPTPFGGLGLNASGSTFRVEPPVVSTPDLAEAIRSNRRTTFYRGSRSTLGRLSSWLNRGLPRTDTGVSGVQDDESDIFPDPDRKEKDEKAYLDTYDVAPYSEPVPAASAIAPKRDVNPPTRQLSPSNSTNPKPGNGVRDVLMRPPAIERNSSTGSPVYGLNGIIRRDEKSSSSSSRDSDMSSLVRQQAELDKSVAGLQLYSDGPEAGSRLTMGISPTQSDFSLSRFPEPPFALAGGRLSGTSGTVTGDDFVVDDVEFTLVPPRMPAVSGNTGSMGSFPESQRGSENVSITLQSRNPMYNSNGTQYDVTSFIGGLTAPAASAPTDLATITSEDEGSDAKRRNAVPAPQPLVVRRAIQNTALPTNPAQPLVLRSGLQTINPQPEVHSLAVPSRRYNPRRPKISAPMARISLEQPAAYEQPRQPPATNPPSSFR